MDCGGCRCQATPPYVLINTHQPNGSVFFLVSLLVLKGDVAEAAIAKGRSLRPGEDLQLHWESHRVLRSNVCL